jgi:hypothetical protein
MKATYVYKYVPYTFTHASNIIYVNVLGSLWKTTHPAAKGQQLNTSAGWQHNNVIHYVCS